MLYTFPINNNSSSGSLLPEEIQKINNIFVKGVYTNYTEMYNNKDKLLIGDIVFVKKAEGVFGINRKKAGFYEKTGNDTFEYKGLDNPDLITRVEVDEKLNLKEDKFNKNTAFNKNFGINAGEVAEGNHNHDDKYLGINDIAKNSEKIGGTDAKIKRFMELAQHNISGGGEITINGNRIKWSKRFIVIGNGKSAETTTDGYFNIEMPSIDTVIHGLNTDDTTVDSNGIELQPWYSLYYKLPLGSNHDTNSNNFYIVRYSGNEVDIPDDFILLYTHNGDTHEFETPIHTTNQEKVYMFPDTRSGCPATQAANTDINLRTINIKQKSRVSVKIQTIGRYNGRFDVVFYLDGQDRSAEDGGIRFLSSDNSSNWKPVTLHREGILNPGDHTFSYRCTKADTVGCGKTRGSMIIKIKPIS